MPELTWLTKRPPEFNAAKLLTDTITYPGGIGYPDSVAANRILLGDNLPLMTALLAEYEDQIDLIYADPPFFTNRNFNARIGRGEDSRKPGEWQLSDGYVDSWKNLDAYLDFLYPRLILMHRLLAPNGTLYLHLDWHADSYARVLLDEIFGEDRLLNQIAWVYHGPSPIRSAFNRKHDTILVYTKGKDYTFNADDVREPYNPNTVKTFNASAKAGFGKIPNLKRGKVPEDWWYFPVVARLHNERTGYPTQKPEALLERIILASSQPGDLVADFFCGSGTTAAVAARLGRRFIASDRTWRAVHTTRARLSSISLTPFTLERDNRFSIEAKNTDNMVVWDQGNKDVQLTADQGVDFWEIDPNWDGRVFHSVTQAQRPLRAGKIISRVPIDGDTLCVRLVKASGELFYQVLKK